MAVFSTPSRRRVITRPLAAGALVLSLLTACDANRQDPSTEISGPAQQLEAKVGDVSVYVAAIQASSIPAEVAREHGIPQRDDLIMLRISPRRKNGNGEIVSAPVQVQATATTLGAARQPLPLREAVANGLVDHIGTIKVRLPETVGFSVNVATPGGASETLTLTGNFSKRP